MLFPFQLELFPFPFPLVAQNYSHSHGIPWESRGNGNSHSHAHLYCEQRDPLNEHPVVDVRARRALLRTLTLWGTWYRARRINPRHTAPLSTDLMRARNTSKQIVDDFFMVALWNRADHIYFHAVSFFFFISSPNLSGRRLDAYHTSTHGVTLVRI